MGQAQDDIWSLVAKYLSDDLSPGEEQKLKTWRESHPDNEASFEQIQRMWDEAPRPADDYQPEVDKGWQRFKFRMESERDHYVKSSANGNHLKPLARQWKFSYSSWAAVAASVAILLSLGVWWWGSPEDTDLLTISTGKDESRMLWLPDSSQVWLNENTEVRYAANFDVNHRVIYMSGEAFFDVKEAEGRRFTIFSEGAKTEVIGTSFNVYAYPDEPVKVQVVSGKVAFSPAAEDNAIFLEPGYEAVMSVESHTIEKKEPIEDLNFRAWQNQHIQFQNTSLKEVIRTLQKVYHTDIELTNPDLANCRYSATFEGENLEDILYVLSITVNLSFEKQGEQYLLTGKGCQ